VRERQGSSSTTNPAISNTHSRSKLPPKPAQAAIKTELEQQLRSSSRCKEGRLKEGSNSSKTCPKSPKLGL